MRVSAAEPKRSKFNILAYAPVEQLSEEKIKVTSKKSQQKKRRNFINDIGESDIVLSDDDEQMKDEPPMDPEKIREQWRQAEMQAKIDKEKNMHKQEALLVKSELEELISFQGEVKQQKMKQLEERREKLRAQTEAAIAELENGDPDKKPSLLQIEVEEPKDSKTAMMEFLGKQLSAKSKE